MTIITEGRLTFTFNAGCTASKYDDWSFYRNQFQKVCGSAKAIDIVCFENRETWLIEVKDYRLPNTQKVINLPNTLAKKIRDTLAGLVAAQCNANDFTEKQIARVALSARRLHLVFHIEQPVKSSRLFPRAIDPADLKQKLKGLLKAVDAHPKIVNQNTITHILPWTVSG